MSDDDISTMQYKLVYMTQDWSPLIGDSFWRVDKEGKAMLANGELKPCKPIPMKNVEDVIKSILGFLQYWDCLRVVDVGGSFHH
jgi:hypothetical protein